MEDGSPLLPFIRFDAEARNITLMPHAKNEDGYHSITVTANETSEGQAELVLNETFEVEVTSNRYTAFTTSPGPVQVIVGSKMTFPLPSIKN